VLPFCTAVLLVYVRSRYPLNQRSPQVGDVGVFIDLLRAPGAPDRYVVEMSGADGVPVWLSEFFVEELESAV